MKFLSYRRVAATATLGICWWKTFQIKYQTKYLTKSTGCWKQHRFQLSTSLVCTNSRSMKDSKYTPIKLCPAHWAADYAWQCMVLQRFCLMFCPKRKEIKRKPLALSKCCKVGYWSGLSAVSLQCLERIQVMAERKIKNNCFVRTSFNFVRQGSTNCTEQIEPCMQCFKNRPGQRATWGVSSVSQNQLVYNYNSLAFRHSLKACTPLKGLTPTWRAGSEG